MSQENNSSYTGRIFDEPLILHGHIDAEPQRYIAEKPFELTRFEYSVLRKSYSNGFWFTLTTGATVGMTFSIIGKSIAALIANQPPTLDLWEVVALLLGVILSCALKFMRKSEGHKEKDSLEGVIDRHFEQNKPRHLHLTGGK